MQHKSRNSKADSTRSLKMTLLTTVIRAVLTCAVLTASVSLPSGALVTFRSTPVLSPIGSGSDFTTLATMLAQRI